MRSLALATLLLLIAPALAHAAFVENHRQPRVSVDKVYAAVRKTGPAQACLQGTPLSSCIYKNPETCTTGFTAALEDCIAGDLKHHEDFLLTDDQQKTVTSAMLTCAQTMAIAQQKNTETYKCLSEAKSPADKVSFEDRYMLTVASDVERLSTKIAAFKTGDRSACVGYTGKYATGCFKKMLKAAHITSVETAALLFDLGLQTAQKDKAAGFDERTASLMAVEVGLLVMEHTVPAKFTIAQMKATTLSEGVSRKILLSGENKTLDAFKDKAAIQLEKTLDQQPSRRPASAPAWQDEREDKLRARLEKFQTRVLAIK